MVMKSCPAEKCRHRAIARARPHLRAQILATEHWSLLATRNAIWQEIFSRTGTFLTILSATVVALSLVIQADRIRGEGSASSRSWSSRSFSSWVSEPIYGWWRRTSRTPGS